MLQNDIKFTCLERAQEGGDHFDAMIEQQRYGFLCFTSTFADSPCNAIGSSIQLRIGQLLTGRLDREPIRISPYDVLESLGNRSRHAFHAKARGNNSKRPRIIVRYLRHDPGIV